jgi:hypothetical protein
VIALCLPRSLSGLICVTPSLTAPLRVTLLSAPHRRRHEQHYKHDRGRDRDHDDAGANREHDKRCGAHHASPSAKPFLQHTRHNRQARAAHEVRGATPAMRGYAERSRRSSAAGKARPGKSASPRPTREVVRRENGRMFGSERPVNFWRDRHVRRAYVIGYVGVGEKPVEKEGGFAPPHLRYAAAAFKQPGTTRTHRVSCGGTATTRA